MAWERFFRSFKPQSFLQFPIADASRVLIGNVVLCKGSVGDAQRELSISIFRIEHAISVFPALSA